VRDKHIQKRNGVALLCFIQKVDEENYIIIMNTFDYESKLLNLLSSLAYKPLTKIPIPLRPIVSTIGTPTHYFTHFLADKLHPLPIKPPPLSNIHPTSSKKIRHFHLNYKDIMVSFYVVSLFTKILVSKSQSLISNLVYPETLNLIEIFLSSTFFTFKGVFYEQTEGTTMVFPVPSGG
jgi:hypothetical protein